MNGCVPLLLQPLGCVKNDRDSCVFFCVSRRVSRLLGGQKNNRVVYGLATNGPTHREVIALHFLSFYVCLFLSMLLSLFLYGLPTNMSQAGTDFPFYPSFIIEYPRSLYLD